MAVSKLWLLTVLTAMLGSSCQPAQNTCQAPQQDQVFRSDSAIHVTVSDGSTVTLPYRMSDTDISYEYIGYLSAIHHHVVRASFWYGEGWGHFLIDHCSGSRTVMQEVPVVSPDTMRLAMTSSSLDADYAPTVLQIWRRSEVGFDLEWEYEPLEHLAVGHPPWGPIEPEWLDPHTVRFQAIGHLGESAGDGLAIYERGEWRITRTAGDPAKPPHPRPEPTP